MAMTSSVAHHIKAPPPVLRAMEAMGFARADCLAGTGLVDAELEQPGPQVEFTLAQEFRFHRNLLELSGDPLLGLKLGRVYTLENYGLLGYAFMSAPTLRHAMTIIRNYGPLSFTLFNIDFEVDGGRAILSFSGGKEIPDDLLCYYVDRDLAAAILGGQAALREPMQVQRVTIMHPAGGRERDYESLLGCTVDFDAPSCSAIEE